ncbi:maleate cis-trans isomerase family protein [Streptomyces genisteinicus]|uniref:Arylmalonate decarboxylase n=1 Tax=Streptomyces genisteinicus TaxID=2768068 RepID=A0A7H0HM18_9ACTN|nr:arylmalonate decarboxylase [Streptomyces genisteinicus]QNP61584.1 arylmalonate decarboxylase [Streptomyces genisteinicus]
MDLFSLPRLGVVVPPENPTAEPEFNHLLGTGLNVYTARFPVTPGTGLRRMLETYNEVLPDTLGDFGGMRLDATVVACSASHYLLGPEGDRALCEELSVRVRHPVRSSTQAVLAACEALGIGRLTLVSPYEPWLTDVSRAYWERAGLAVDGVVPVPAGRTPAGTDQYDPYAVPLGRIRERVRAHLGGRRTPDGSALMFTGTGMATLAALRELAREEPGRVLLTSNLASAWWARRATGARGGPVHPLLRRLDAGIRRAA